MTYKVLLSVGLALLTTPLFAAEAGDAAVSEATALEQETVTPAPAATTTAVEQSGFSRGSVVRSAFTTEVKDREPASDLKTITNNEGTIIYYTELRDMSGQTATHRWEYNGEVKAEVTFNVRGPRWRVWSSKNFVPGWTGDWKVSVLNGAGEVISEDMFNYAVAEVTETPAAAPAEPAAIEPAAPATVNVQ